MNNNKLSVVVKGVELRWPFLGHPNDKGEFASGKYQTDIVCTKAQKDLIDSLPRSGMQKFKALDGDQEGLYTITLKTKNAPRVVNKDKMKMSPEELEKVGNGSIANIKVIGYNARGKDFIGLGAMCITQVEEYTGAAEFDDLVEDDAETASLASSDDDDDEDDLG